MKNQYFLRSPIGILKLEDNGEALTGLYFVSEDEYEAGAPSAIAKRAEAQLMEYFKGERKEFDIQLMPSGTPFQMKVWNALQTIPYGETKSYGKIAAQIGKPRACRAVGMANNRNPISIIIPCHRVIGADGSLTGYGGGLDIKRTLLTLEGVKCDK